MRGKATRKELLAAAVIDSATMSIKAASAKHGVSVRSVERAKATGGWAPQLAELGGKFGAYLSEVAALAVARCRLPQAEHKDINETLKVLGWLDAQAQVLDESDGSDRERPEAQAPPGRETIAHIHLDAQ